MEYVSFKKFLGYYADPRVAGPSPQGKESRSERKLRSYVWRERTRRIMYQYIFLLTFLSGSKRGMEKGELNKSVMYVKKGREENTLFFLLMRERKKETKTNAVSH